MLYSLPEGGADNMDMPMRRFTIKPFTKYVIIRVGLFESKIIDECNMGTEDEEKLIDFKTKYMDRDDCVIVKINM